MKLKTSKRLFWGLIIFINIICISLAVWEQIQFDQEALRWNLWIEGMRLLLEDAVIEAQKIQKRLESNWPILVWTDTFLYSLNVVLSSVLFVFAFLLIGFHRKKVYKKNREFHELIQNYLEQKYDASVCPEFDLWMHRKSNVQNIVFLISMLVIFIVSPLTAITDSMWYVFVFLTLFIGIALFIGVHYIKTGKYIIAYYEKYKRPVDAMKAWYCVRCEDKIVAYKIKLYDLCLAMFLHRDGAYEESEIIAEFVWGRFKERYRKGTAAIQYYYIKYLNSRKLGLDAEGYLQKLYQVIEENPKIEFGKTVKQKILEIDECNNNSDYSGQNE